MKSMNKFSKSSSVLSEMPYQNRPCWMLTPLLVLSIFLCSGRNNLGVAGTSYTVDSIADGLINAEAQFTNLRLDYVFIHKAWNNPKAAMHVTEGIYVHKKCVNMPKALRYLDRKVYYVVDPNRERSSPYEDTLAAFDGQATRILHRRDDSGKPLESMKGYILAGCEKGAFPIFMGDPHTTIWYFAGKQLGQFLKEQKDKFHIESQSELLNGVSTVKVVGTLWMDQNTGESRTMKLWISPERNFLPMKLQRLRNVRELAWETALYDLVKLPNGMWYPKTVRSPADPPGTPNPPMLQIYNISKISVDPLSEEFFRPQFPPKTRVLDDILKVSYTTTD